MRDVVVNIDDHHLFENYVPVEGLNTVMVSNHQY